MQESNKYTYIYIYDTTPEEVRSLFGLMYHGVVNQHFHSIHTVFHHKSSCGHFMATMNKFFENCTAMMVPLESTAIDKTLYPYRERVLIYNHNKPATFKGEIFPWTVGSQA